MGEYIDQMEAVVAAWTPYLETINNWQEVVKGVEPKLVGCGLVYELYSHIDRPNESIAVADMRSIKFAEPHYHPKGTEIYVVLQGSGLIVVGHSEEKIEKGSVIIIPPETSHFTIPDSNLILAVINTPSFDPDDYIVLDETNDDVSFDQEQFTRLTS